MSIDPPDHLPKPEGYHVDPVVRKQIELAKMMLDMPMNEKVLQAYERKADEMFQSMMKSQFELESGSIVMPESFYTTIGK